MTTLWTQLQFMWRRTKLGIMWGALGIAVIVLYVARQQQLAKKLVLQQRAKETRFEIDKLHFEWKKHRISLGENLHLRSDLEAKRKRLLREYETRQLEIEGKSRVEIVKRLRELGF